MVLIVYEIMQYLISKLIVISYFIIYYYRRNQCEIPGGEYLLGRNKTAITDFKGHQ